MSNQWPSERPSTTMRHARRQRTSVLPLLTVLFTALVLLAALAGFWFLVEVYVTPAVEGFTRTFGNS